MATVNVFHQRLHDLMRDRHMTHAELAQLTGLNQNTIDACCTRNMPTLKTAVKIAKALDCSIDYLAGVDDAAVPVSQNVKLISADALIEDIKKRRDYQTLTESLAVRNLMFSIYDYIIHMINCEKDARPNVYYRI